MVKFDNYKKLGITGYAINFGIPVVVLNMIIAMGGHTRGMAPLLHMAVFFPLLGACYIYGLVCLIGWIIDINKHKSIETSAFFTIGIVMYFLPVVMFLLMDALYNAPFFLQY